MTNAACTIAIVMPTRNQARFIEASIASVLGQGVAGLQLFVQDGASSDGTLGVLARLSAMHPNLHWVSEPDAGPADALNRAFARALAQTGAPVLGWLNSDDLYTPGAVARALAAFDAQPDALMVYGEGEHVDEAGARIDRYPTLPPPAPVDAFAQGCFVCQPTVFLRRSVCAVPGPLDTTLRTAFDFDWWLRIWRAHPGRIGFVPAGQAQTRLHAGAITWRQREQVALEGMAVLHRHLGSAPPHWLLTHIAERCATHPFDDGPPRDLRADVARLVADALPFVDAAGAELLRTRIASDQVLLLATPQLLVAVHPDGWAPPALELRVRQPAHPAVALRLRGRHAHPRGGPLHLQASADGALLQTLTVPANGPFDWTLPLPDQRPDARLLLRITTDEGFVPAEIEAGSSDTRRLAWQVDAVELVAQD